ncbi:MAG: peptidoglycan-binding protein [Ruminococcus sp.]|nr:peptidoglycan-binding protein [Candidatus Apopatosoma intestinale]
MDFILPVIPETITVHLGAPNTNARNVTVTFPDYIKNVASSEIYPTWPESAIRANIYAQISFALNRIYTEYYRSAGYDFDITNNTAFDQAFVYEREIFENISRIVDEIFNSYIRREGAIEPLYALYCNGTTTTCNGLSQWGSVSLANEGNGAFDILQNYYGDTIELVTNAPIEGIRPSVPGGFLRLGSIGNEVRFLQVRLNRISANYPAIPKIQPVDGIFGPETEDAVRAFQRIFNLDVDGVVGPATWYKVQFIFNAVKRLNELESEGITLDDVSNQFPRTLEPGSSGIGVTTVQYYLRVIATFNPLIPDVELTGYYGDETTEAVSAFQSVYGIPVTGIVDEETWDSMFDVYYGLVSSLTENEVGVVGIPFPGRYLRLGSAGDDVTALQTYINAASQLYGQIPEIPVTGVFDENTRDAMYAVQALFDLPISGVVGPVAWNILSEIYSDVISGETYDEGQYPGSAAFENGTESEAI